jgi:hypothetical protein
VQGSLSDDDTISTISTDVSLVSTAGRLVHALRISLPFDEGDLLSS